jgi:hypothetical protein
VPAAQEVVAQAPPAPRAPLQEGERYRSVTSTYGGVEQRWVLIDSEPRPAQAPRLVDKQRRTHSEKERKACKQLCRTACACQADAQQALTALAHGLPATFLSEPTVRATPC